MGDYRQLATEYVLTDDKKRLSEIADAAAAKLRLLPAESRLWVQSVSPWLDGGSGDDMVDDGDDGMDYVARAKALEFLASTLQRLDQGQPVLGEQQVTLLVAFFCSMYKNDHMAGIIPATKALSSLVDMDRFKPNQGVDIVESIASIGEDFRKQPPHSRTVIYRLLRKLVTHDTIKVHLESRWGASSGFLIDMLQICRAERDPHCLVEWFATISFFLSEYSHSEDVAREAFDVFSQYFPITVRATSNPASITAEDLKQALRNCFAAHYSLSPLVVPFILGKLDQGDGLTVAVRLDILRTLDACMSRYDRISLSVSAPAEKIWTSLKYEVRNGEEQEAIAQALAVIRTIARRLDGDDLKRFLSKIMFDCQDDLNSATYAEAAGKLLISAMSAKPAAFQDLSGKCMASVRTLLQAQKPKLHVRDLVAILNALLELRLALLKEVMDSETKSCLSVDDSVLEALYRDCYEKLIEVHVTESAIDDDVMVSCKLVQGVGLLARQTQVAPSEEHQPLVLNDTTISAACSTLTRVLLEYSHRGRFENLTKETQVALAKVNSVFAPCIRIFTSMAMPSHGSGSPSPENLSDIGSILAFIGCTELPESGDKLDRFLFVLGQQLSQLRKALDGGEPPSVWCSLAGNILNSMLYFRNRCLPKHMAVTLTASQSTEGYIQDLPRLVDEAEPSQMAFQPGGVENDFICACLFSTRQLYRRAVQVEFNEVTGEPDASLGPDFRDDYTQTDAQNRYLLILSRIARLAVKDITGECQSRLGLVSEIFTLFRGDATTPPGAPGRPGAPSMTYNTQEYPQSYWRIGRAFQLSVGIIEGLEPSSMTSFFGSQWGYSFIMAAMLVRLYGGRDQTRHVMRSILANLANKLPIEKEPRLHDCLEMQLSLACTPSDKQPEVPGRDEHRLNLCENALVMLNGIVRRMKGSSETIAMSIRLLSQAPGDTRTGHSLARSMEYLVAPIMDEENARVVVLPTWRQRVFYQLVGPLMESGLPRPKATDGDLITRSNYRLAVLALVRWMKFSDYQNQAQGVLKIALCVIRDLPKSRDVESALQVVRNIIENAPDEVREHLNSITKACQQVLAEQASTSYKRPSWMPEDYVGKTAAVHSQACRKLALNVLQLLPVKYEARLLGSSAAIQRLLTVACGFETRELRAAARLARGAWKSV